MKEKMQYKFLFIGSVIDVAFKLLHESFIDFTQPWECLKIREELDSDILDLVEEYNLIQCS